MLLADLDGPAAGGAVLFGRKAGSAAAVEELAGDVDAEEDQQDAGSGKD